MYTCTYVDNLFFIPCGSSTKRHLYWAMKNCNGNADELQKSILNISKHYQVCLDNTTMYASFLVRSTAMSIFAFIYMYIYRESMQVAILNPCVGGLTTDLVEFFLLTLM